MSPTQTALTIDPALISMSGSPLTESAIVDGEFATLDIFNDSQNDWKHFTLPDWNWEQEKLTAMLSHSPVDPEQKEQEAPSPDDWMSDFDFSALEDFNVRHDEHGRKRSLSQPPSLDTSDQSAALRSQHFAHPPAQKRPRPPDLPSLARAVTDKLPYHPHRRPDTPLPRKHAMLPPRSVPGELSKRARLHPSVELASRPQSRVQLLQSAPHQSLPPLGQATHGQAWATKLPEQSQNGYEFNLHHDQTTLALNLHTMVDQLANQCKAIHAFIDCGFARGDFGPQSEQRVIIERSSFSNLRFL